MVNFLKEIVKFFFSFYIIEEKLKRGIQFDRRWKKQDLSLIVTLI